MRRGHDTRFASIWSRCVPHPVLPMIPRVGKVSGTRCCLPPRPWSSESRILLRRLCEPGILRSKPPAWFACCPLNKSRQPTLRPCYHAVSAPGTGYYQAYYKESHASVTTHNSSLTRGYCHQYSGLPRSEVKLFQVCTPNS